MLRNACLKSCLLGIPYGTILATLMSLCGIAIVTVSLLESTAISDQLLFELLHRKFLWFNDLKVIYIILCVLLLIIVLINLLVGCMTTGRRTTNHTGGGPSVGCGLCGPATGCLVKTIFILNYILFYAIVALTLIFAIALFVCFIMSSLCTDGKTVSESYGTMPPSSEVSDSNQQLNLRLFAPLLGLRANETDYLLFKDHKLKKFCIDYLSSLYLYVTLCFAGFLLLCIGFLNYLINLSVNWARVTTSQKCAELIYLNSAEMTAFGSSSVDNGGGRF
ncbi:uncharacterized protein LOC141855130 isoform X2 [Brevipalpus obovatus]|uniref:uncharacterized protein LOC141855130 isoform X2 n=1 Tax=Brevipalpus obovatus TaxID=246614 RepID=UPI003D9FA10A